MPTPWIVSSRACPRSRSRLICAPSLPPSALPMYAISHSRFFEKRAVELPTPEGAAPPVNLAKLCNTAGHTAIAHVDQGQKSHSNLQILYHARYQFSKVAHRHGRGVEIRLESVQWIIQDPQLMNGAKTLFEYVQEISPSHTLLTSQSIISLLDSSTSTVPAKLLISMVEAHADHTATLARSVGPRRARCHPWRGHPKRLPGARDRFQDELVTWRFVDNRGAPQWEYR